MDWAALDAYLRAAGASGRVVKEPEAGRTLRGIDAGQALAYRAKIMHLNARLPARSHATDSYGGLQDSAPRSALLSLHARVRDIEPNDWEDPSLVQIWFRYSDYVVPRDALAVFTLGTLPRDPAQIAALNGLADAVVSAIGDRPRSSKEVVARLPDLPNQFLIRAASATGRILIRWDASTLAVIPAKAPDADPEESRVELARRFLHWLAPAGPAHFAKWAHLSRDDAAKTWSALEAELVPVDFEGRARWCLADDEPSLIRAKSTDTVRLLPMGDPYLYLDREFMEPANPPKPDLAPDVSRRLVNSLAGRILSNGELVGAWGRVQNNLTLFPWRPLSQARIDQITAEAELMSGPIGKPIKIRWIA